VRRSMLPMLILSIFLSFLVCAPAGAITLSGHTGQCPVLSLRSSNRSCINALQRQLNRDNVRPLLTVDGIFGQLTLNNVESFQRSRGLPADGIVGAATARALALVLQRHYIRGRPQIAPPSITRSVNRPIIISLQDAALIGVFLLLTVIVVLLGKRIRHLELTLRQMVKIDLVFGLTDAELKAKTLELLVRLREIMAADAAVETYQKAAELIKAVYLAGNSNARAHNYSFRRQPAMIEGRVEKD
jgi:hypothetical protein